MGLEVDSHNLRLPPAEKVSKLFAGIEELREAQRRAEEDGAKYSNNRLGDFARSRWFETVTLTIIVINAVEMGWNADWTARGLAPEDLWSGPMGFIVAENFFAVYFTLEILVRFAAYRKKLHCLMDFQFVFDLLLVCFMVLETWVLPLAGGGGGFVENLSILRLLRLARLTRLMRILKALPELLLIITSLAAAARAVIWTMVLMMVITLLWAILLTSQYHQGKRTDEEVDLLLFQPDNPDRVMYYFGSMGRCFLSLICRGIMLDDLTYTLDSIRLNQDWGMLVAFIAFVFLNSLTMMNFLVGILVEMVASNADGERQRRLEETVRDTIQDVCKRMDSDGSGLISRAEFLAMRSDRKVAKVLDDFRITDRHFSMYADMIFTTTEETANGVNFTEVFSTICRARPDTTMSSLDFAGVRQSLAESRYALEEQLQRISALIEQIASGGSEDSLSTPEEAG